MLYRCKYVGDFVSACPHAHVMSVFHALLCMCEMVWILLSRLCYRNTLYCALANLFHAYVWNICMLI